MAAVGAVLDEVWREHHHFVARLDDRAEETHHGAGGSDRHHDMLRLQVGLLLARKVLRHSLAHGWDSGVGAVAEAKRLSRGHGDRLKRVAHRAGRRHVWVAEREVAHRVFAELAFELQPLLEHPADPGARRHRIADLVRHRLHRYSSVASEKVNSGNISLTAFS